eukprot:541692_1
MAEQKTDSPSVRFIYFGMQGRAGPLRCAASIGGLSYEDRFMTFDEHKVEKAEGKRRWSGLPEMTVFDKDGRELVNLGHSNTCLRYVGRLTGLYPKNRVQRALVDEVLDAIEDITGLMSPSFHEKDEEKKKAMREALLADDKLPYWIQKFEDRFEENEKKGNKNGYIVGDELTIADIKFYMGVVGMFMSGHIDYIDGKKLLGDSKRIMAFAAKLKENEKISKFVSQFDSSSKEYKENKKSCFKYGGTNSYG